MNKEVMSIAIPSDVKLKIKHIAKLSGLSCSQLVSDIIARYIADHEKD